MNKLASTPKKYTQETQFRLVSIRTGFRFFFGLLWIPLWVFTPICWHKGHSNRVLYPYGFKVKQCQRCGKVHYSLKTKESIRIAKSFQQGYIGELSGVRFIQTKSK